MYGFIYAIVQLKAHTGYNKYTWVAMWLLTLALFVGAHAQPLLVTGAYAVATPHGGAQVLVSPGTPLPGTLAAVTLYLELSTSTLDAYLLEAFALATLVPDTNADGSPLQFATWASAVLAGLPHCAAGPDALWRYERWGPRGAPTLLSTCAVVPPGSPGVRAWLPAGVLPARGPDAAAAAAADVPVGHPVLALGVPVFNRTGVSPASSVVVFGAPPDAPFPGDRWPSNGSTLSVVGANLVLCAWLPVNLSAPGGPWDWDCSVTATAGEVTSQASDGVRYFGTVTPATLRFIPDYLLNANGAVTLRVAGSPSGAVPFRVDPWWSWTWNPGGGGPSVACGTAGAGRLPGGMPPAWLSEPVNVTRGTPFVTVAPAPGVSGNLTAARVDGGVTWTWATPPATGPLDGPLAVLFQAPVSATPSALLSNFTAWLLPRAANNTVFGPESDAALGPFSLSADGVGWAINVSLPTWMPQVLPEFGGTVAWSLVLRAPNGVGFAPSPRFSVPLGFQPAHNSVASEPVVWPDTRLPPRSVPGESYMVVGTVYPLHCSQLAGELFTEGIRVANADVAPTSLDWTPVLRFRGGTPVGGTDVFPEGDTAWWLPAPTLAFTYGCERVPVFRVGAPETISPHFWTVLPRPTGWLTHVVLRVHVPRAVVLAFNLTTTGASDAAWTAAAPACYTRWGYQPRAVLNTTATPWYPGGAVLDTACFMQINAANLAALRVPVGAFAPLAPLFGDVWGPGPANDAQSTWLWFGDGPLPSTPTSAPPNGSVLTGSQLLVWCPLVDLAARDNGTVPEDGAVPRLTAVCSETGGRLGADVTPTAVKGRRVDVTNAVTQMYGGVTPNGLNATRGVAVFAYWWVADVAQPGPWWSWDPVAVMPEADPVDLLGDTQAAYPVACFLRRYASSPAYGWASPDACTSADLTGDTFPVSATRWDGVRVVYHIPILTRGHVGFPADPPIAPEMWMYGLTQPPIWKLAVCPVRRLPYPGRPDLDTLRADCSPQSIVGWVWVNPRWYYPRYVTWVAPGDFDADVASLNFVAHNNTVDVVQPGGLLLYAVVSLFPDFGPELTCTQTPGGVWNTSYGISVSQVVHSYPGDVLVSGEFGNLNESANSTVMAVVQVPAAGAGVAVAQLPTKGFNCKVFPTDVYPPNVITGPAILLVSDPGPAPTRTASWSRTPTTTSTPSPTVSPSVSATISITPSRSPTISITPSRTPTISVTPSRTPSRTPTISVTPSRTGTTSRTPSVTATPSRSVTPSTNWLRYPYYPVYLVPVKSDTVAGQSVVTIHHPEKIFVGNYVVESANSAYTSSQRLTYVPRIAFAATSWFTEQSGNAFAAYAVVADFPRHRLTNASFTVASRTSYVSAFLSNAASLGFTIRSSDFAGATDPIPTHLVFLPASNAAQFVQPSDIYAFVYASHVDGFGATIATSLTLNLRFCNIRPEDLAAC